MHADSLTVRVGVEDNLPLQSISYSSQPEGLVLDVLRYIAGEEDWQLEFVSCEWARCLEMLENGEIDLLGGIAYSETRAQRFDFSSEALITNWGMVCVDPISKIDSILDLQDRSIAMLPDDIYTLAFQDLMHSFGIDFTEIQADTYAEALAAIQAGTADAGVVSRLFATQNAGDYDVIPSTIIFNPIEIRYAATKGRHSELLQTIDSNLIALKENPSSYYYQALSKWFGGAYHEVPSWVGWLLSFTGWAIIVFLIAMFSLRRQVQARTAELAEGYQQLQVEFAERRKAELALRDLNEQLEQRVKERTAQLENVNKELEAFAYSVSHDLRSPVRAIEAYSDIILSEYSADLSEEARFYQERVRANAMEMDHLIEALLVFSRLNRQALTKELVDPAAIAQQVVSDQAHEIQNKKTAIRVEPMPLCSADLILLKQVYANLISNAIKFSQEKPEPKIVVGCKQELNEIVYFVQDNGVGFDMEIKDRLFEAFKRLHAADEYEGHGIGLAMVQRIVQRHGGRIWADSVQGEGATFYFTLG